MSETILEAPAEEVDEPVQSDYLKKVAVFESLQAEGETVEAPATVLVNIAGEIVPDGDPTAQHVLCTVGDAINRKAAEELGIVPKPPKVEKSKDK